MGIDYCDVIWLVVVGVNGKLVMDDMLVVGRVYIFLGNLFVMDFVVVVIVMVLGVKSYNGVIGVNMKGKFV